MVTIKANNVLLPSPDEVKTGDEIIWSANTGRSSTGLMIGDVVAEKMTIEISWGVLTRAQFLQIKSNLRSGFHPFELSIDRETVTIDSYRGTLTGEILGTHGGTTFYKSAAVSIIQQ